MKDRLANLLANKPLTGLIVAAGLAGGVAMGLGIGWLLWPVRVARVDVADLKDSAKNEYLTLIAKTFAFDQNLERARERLALLNDSAVLDRVMDLAFADESENKPEATQLAALAIALGATDNDIALIAQSGAPTLLPASRPTFTPSPSQVATSTSLSASTDVPTARLFAPISSATPTRRRFATSTPKPSPTLTVTPVTATSTPKPPTPSPTATPVPIPATTWLPSYPGEWPGGAGYQPVSAAPGQRFWHLARALYCDTNDERNNCPNLPGGGTGTSTYVMLIDAGGNRTTAPLLINGSLSNEEQKSADDPCQCNYSFPDSDATIQIGGAPSDAISGLALYSVKARLSQYHVRYFLWFQYLTR